MDTEIKKYNHISYTHSKMTKLGKALKMYSISSKNYKILRKEISENLNKWRSIMCP